MRDDTLSRLSGIAAMLVPCLLSKELSEQEKQDEFMRYVPEILNTLQTQRTLRDAIDRADFVAHHAAMLVQTLVETTEDDDALKSGARRAVKLAGMVYDLAHGAP